MEDLLKLKKDLQEMIKLTSHVAEEDSSTHSSDANTHTVIESIEDNCMTVGTQDAQTNMTLKQKQRKVLAQKQVRRLKMAEQEHSNGQHTIHSKNEKRKVKLNQINPKEKLQKDAKIITDGPRTGIPQQSQTVSTVNIVTARKNNAKDTSCTKSTKGSVSKSSSRHNTEHCSRSRSRSCSLSRSNSRSCSRSRSRSQSRSWDRRGRTDQYRSRSSSSRERRRGGSKERSDGDRRGRSRSRDRSHKSWSRSRSRDRGARTDPHRGHRSSSRERRRGGSKERSDRDRRSRSRSRERAARHKQSRSRSRERSRDRDRGRDREGNRERDRERRKSPSPERRDQRHWRRSSSPERSSRRRSRSRSSSPRRKTSTVSAAALKTPTNLGPGSKDQTAPMSTSISRKSQVGRSLTVDEELARGRKELDELNELIHRRKAEMSLAQQQRKLGVAPKAQTGSQPLLLDEEAIPKWLPLNRDHNQDAKSHTAPIKSILKKPKQPLPEPTSPPKVDNDLVPTKTSVSQPPSGRVFPIALSSDHTDLSLPHQSGQPFSACTLTSMSAHPAVLETPKTLSSDRTELILPRQSVQPYPARTLMSGSAHPAVLETPSNPPFSHRTETPVPQRPSSPPQQQMGPEAKSNVSVQMQRFLNLLNQGVDSSLLSAMVKEAREESASIEQQHSVASLNLGEPQRDELYDPFRDTEEQDCSAKDYLLPHERAVEDGSGFSRIVGMKSGLYVEEQFLRKSKVEEEEKYLYGDSVTEDEHHDHYSRGPGRNEILVLPEQSREERLSKPTQHKEVVTAAAGKGDDEDRIQKLFKSFGVDIDSFEVSQLTDRTRERLYGTKAATVSTEHSKRKHSPIRHHSQTNSSDSDHFRSVSPDKSSKRQVFMSYRDQPQHSSKYEPHQEKKRRTMDLRSLTRTIRNTPESTTPEPPESEYVAGSSSSLPPDPSQITYQPPAVEDYAYPDQTPYAGPQYTELSYTPTSFVVDHSGLPPPPQNVYSPYTLTAGQTYPSQTYPPAPIIVPTGLPPPSMSLSSSYSTVHFPTNPSSSHSYTDHHLSGSTTIPIVQRQAIQSTEQKLPVKSRCLTVIQTEDVASVESETPSKAVLVQPNPVPTLDDIKARQKKKLELFNQRMKEKNEKLREARRAHGKKESTTGIVTSTEVKNVWICGHSLVTWAEKRAKVGPEFAMQLGMDPNSVGIWWKGVQGMTWDQLVPQLHQLKLNWPNPDLLLIHLGGNDINKIPMEELLRSIKKDLTSISSIFPQCLVVWSDILPRRVWKQGVMPVEAVDRIRVLINCKVHAMLAELGGTAVTHENIVGPELYRPDGVHLSGRGLDTFNLNLQDFLEKWEMEGLPGN